LSPDRRSQADPDVETQLMLLQTPFGGGPHQRERERAAAWLVEHAERAYPALFALLEQGRAGPAVVALVPAFGRAESVAPLARLLARGDGAWGAAQALAGQPQAEAGEALHAALSSDEPDVVVAALGGLAARGDESDCRAVTGALDHANARVRLSAVRAATSLGCLDRPALQRVARDDADEQVRQAAADALEGLEP
jgi:hypothetical protein